VDAAVLAEQGGFDAVWVRDLLLWTPHGMEGDNRTFVEPIVSLAAIASRTTKIYLGTAVLIPVRPPLKLAQNLASLSYVAGGRVIAGLGLGSGQKELGAAGFQRSDRKRIFIDTTEILAEVWTRDGVDYQGQMFSFEDVTIEPKPVEPIPMWYGGTTPISVENAVRYCQGWMPGRTPLATLDARLAYLDELAAQAVRKITKSVIPLVKVDRDRAKARAGIDVDALAGSSEASKTWIMPKGGFNTVDDLGGIIAAGEPEEVVEQVAEYGARGIDHFVFDLRLQYDEYERALSLIAEEVLPRLRAMKA
jgi:alkanesulfonate monooxygenase SsuD/methylene tetrahydromethanopterin reductase-like flavin-dependent oxidoreductase (luciferase family)